MHSTPSDLARELEAVLGAARAEFIAELPSRVNRIDSLLTELAPPDGAAGAEGYDPAAALAALRSEMHRIAGLCGTLGFDDLRRDGTKAEEVLRPLALDPSLARNAEARDAAVACVLTVRAGLARLGEEAGS